MSDIFHLDRRTMLQRTLLLLGATVAGTTSAAIAALAVDAKPYLDAPMFSVLSAVSDTIIPRTDTPGAVDVRVPALLDTLLVNWASASRRTEMTGALAKVDQLAVSQEGKGFAALPPPMAGVSTPTLPASRVALLRSVIRDTGVVKNSAAPALPRQTASTK